MTYETIESRNYDLDLVIAESRGITVDEVDALPLDTVELLREKIVSESPNEWGVR
jgi:hypothetical protein